MKTNWKAGLKRESAKNERECWEMLALARTIHPHAVIIDATRKVDGGVKYSSYTYEGETLLQQRAEVMVTQPDIYDLVVKGSGGTLMAVLTDNGHDADGNLFPQNNKLGESEATRRSKI